MTTPPLATVTELGLFMQETIPANDPSADLILTIAMGVVRDKLKQQVSQVVGDVVLLDPVNGRHVGLPEWPVTAVSKVETFGPDPTSNTGAYVWTIADPASYRVSLQKGIIEGVPWSGVDWPSDAGSWRVTYTHGYVSVPDSLMGVVLGIAARAYTSSAGVDMERIGGYQVKYQMLADGFTAQEKVVLNSYRLLRAP